MVVLSQNFTLLITRIFLALGIGILIGLEREQSESAGYFAGSRTFPLIALLGALIQAFFPQLLPYTLIMLIIPLTVAYIGKIICKNDLGLTTFLSALLTYILGAMAIYSEESALIAIIITGVIIILLSQKMRLHDFAKGMSEEEKVAMVKFIVVILIIFPLLPDKEISALYGLNPRFIWLMVLFVTSLNSIAYVLSKLIGAKKGFILTGILGGFISSTATTVTMSGRTKDLPKIYKISAFSIIIASIVMFPRALIEVSVVNSSLIKYLWVPLGAMSLFGSLVCGYIYLKTDFDEKMEHEMKNPLRLKTALFFGLILAIVLLVSDVANNLFGASGVYLTAFFSGLADVDAMTLTLSKLSAEGSLGPGVATTGIVLAAISNTLVKAFLAFALGTYKLGRFVLVILGITSLIGLIFVFI